MSVSQNNISQFFQQKKNVSEAEKNKIKSSQAISKKINIESTEDDEAVLKKFDLDPRYGPSIGLTRTERYENAKRFGLNPPENIPHLVERTQSNICFYDK